MNFRGHESAISKTDACHLEAQAVYRGLQPCTWAWLPQVCIACWLHIMHGKVAHNLPYTRLHYSLSLVAHLLLGQKHRVFLIALL